MTKMRAHGTFVFHNVGQGLFYDGNINLNLADSKHIRFSFIYDCGSVRKDIIIREINRYKKRYLASKRLDMLIISHLHKDHVNGLDELLQGIRVDYVFLPYLLPAERLILALMYPDMPSWYYDFLYDPVIYLLNRDVGTVVLFGAGGEEGEGGTPPENIPPEPPKEKDGKKLWVKLDDAPESNKKIIEEENAQNIYSLYIQEGRLIVGSHKGYVIALGIWVFRFFNYNLRLKSLNNFYSCVRNILQDVDIKDAIKQKDTRKKLKICYESIKSGLGSDFNNTSLITYHMPVGNYHAKFFLCDHCVSCCFCRYSSYPYLFFPSVFQKRSGQFLTGDIDLNYNYREIRNHFQHYLPHTFLVQIPHHGDCKNWNHDILRNVPPHSLWIVSAGIRNSYGHPNLNIIDELICNGHYFAWSNELRKVIIKGEVEW